MDSATDTIDECTSYIDEQERKNRENKDTSHAASIKEGKKRREDCHYQRRLVEFSIDERRAKELCEKVGNMVNANEHTETPGGGHFTLVNRIDVRTKVHGENMRIRGREIPISKRLGFFHKVIRVGGDVIKLLLALCVLSLEIARFQG